MRRFALQAAMTAILTAPLVPALAQGPFSPGPPPGGAARNPLTVIHRWQILDNLRRSVVPIASLLLLLFGGPARVLAPRRCTSGTRPRAGRAPRTARATSQRRRLKLPTASHTSPG